MAETKPGRRAAERARQLIRRIQDSIGRDKLPSVSEIARRGHDPFEILISTLISLRTKDEVTTAASDRLFALAATPAEMAALPPRAIAKAIYPAGFYRTKATQIRDIARRLVAEHDGVVPDNVDDLLAFKGVGRKTATLVVGLGYARPAICVDTHVHRISNRLGLIATKNPTETEFALMDLLPRQLWIGTNELMVSFGQQVCKPLSPHCSDCPVRRSCPRRGVTRSR